MRGELSNNEVTHIILRLAGELAKDVNNQFIMGMLFVRGVAEMNEKKQNKLEH